MDHDCPNQQITPVEQCLDCQKEEVEFSWIHVKSRDEIELFYRSILPKIREAAKLVGYAIGIHGSLRRDLDLIAVPWVDAAVNKDDLASAIQKAACGLVSQSYQWEEKPLGRMATCFPICWADFDHGALSLGHVDLSVTPAQTT